MKKTNATNYRVEMTTEEIKATLSALRNYRIEICEWIIKVDKGAYEELKQYFNETTKLIEKFELIENSPF